jgi:hypothetical protein
MAVLVCGIWHPLASEHPQAGGVDVDFANGSGFKPGRHPQAAAGYTLAGDLSQLQWAQERQACCPAPLCAGQRLRRRCPPQSCHEGQASTGWRAPLLDSPKRVPRPVAWQRTSCWRPSRHTCSTRAATAETLEHAQELAEALLFNPSCSNTSTT